MVPCILFVDEIEKARSGVASSGQTDSGVSARLFSSLLTWLSDHTSDVYFIATSNDIAKLPPEFSRAERFDGVFFLDLPTNAGTDALYWMHTITAAASLSFTWFGVRKSLTKVPEEKQAADSFGTERDFLLPPAADQPSKNK